MTEVKHNYGLYKELEDGSHECGACDYVADEGNDVENYKDVAEHLVMKHDVDPADQSKTLEDANNAESSLQ